MATKKPTKKVKKYVPLASKMPVLPPKQGFGGNNTQTPKVNTNGPKPAIVRRTGR